MTTAREQARDADRVSKERREKIERLILDTMFQEVDIYDQARLAAEKIEQMLEDEEDEHEG